ncbi:TonB-dependent receptor [uncultured Draconibacterium sp.]|uniref:TonB-dependent receptor n=1 Tax=uncultured Draconibacterium sp. TaxID=1573823 RepID=UPI0025EF0BCF|nr:TonB-dependent receptor [uncultured Draconibacterium sp.]
MKLTVLVSLLFVVSVAAKSTYSQATKLSLNLNNSTVKQVFDQVEEQSEFVFLYKTQELDENRLVSVSVENAVINEIMDEVLDGQNLNYFIIDRQVIIREKMPEKSVAPTVIPQGKTISGTVVNGLGEPLPGATVVIKGTQKGVLTNVDGVFTLSAVEPSDVLLVSFVGMKSVEIEVGDQSTINLQLFEDIIGLEEVVAIGYGVSKKKDLTGAVSVVKAEDILRVPTTNAMEAMQGLVPGMTISRSSGAAGAGVDILIRGNRSINGSSAPLFIVDGVQGVNYQDINANDIESINVLKDASSTAIYGSQGANGVVIITTKKGKAGKARVSYNGYFGLNGFTKYPDSRMGDDYVQLRREANRTAGIWSSVADDSKIFADYELDAIQNNEWTNWRDLVLQNGILQNHVVTVTGGTDNFKALFTVGYMNEEGQYVNDEMDKYTARLNLDYGFAEWGRIGLNSQLTYYDIDRRTDPINLSLYTSPFGEPYDENGNVNVYPIEGRSIISPLADEAASVIAVNSQLRTNSNISGFLELTPVKGLTYKSSLSVALRNSRNGSFFSEESIAKMGSSREAKYNAANSRYVNFDNILTYGLDAGEHSLKLTGLASFIKSKYDYVTGSGLNQLIPSQLFYSLQGSEEGTKKVESGYTEHSSMSVAGRLNYGFKDKYLLTATMRYDGASRLSEENRWDYFPSVGAAWRISEEDFMQNFEKISNVKLRASYGMAGNSGISPYGTQTTMSLSTGFSFGNEVAPYYSINTYGNPNLGWEKSKTTNIGIDFGMFQNRVSLTADYYWTTTSDILLSRTLPWSTGGKNKNVYQNIGETKNKGLELALQTVNFDQKDFRWTSSFTFSKSNEHISKLIDDENIYWINGMHTSLIIGEPIYTFYNYVSDGIWQLGEEAEMAKFNENGHSYEPGDIKVRDLNGDYIIDGDNDRAPIGSENPDWEGGMSNTIQYKNFDFNVYFYARMGQEIWGEVLGRYNGNGLENGPALIDYWTPENPSNDYPRPDANISSLYQYQHADVLHVTSGSFIKLKNISLGYTLPNSLTSRVSLEKVRVYVTGSNLATWVKDDRLKNYDPERGGSESSPLTRQLIFGVNINL